MDQIKYLAMINKLIEANVSLSMILHELEEAGLELTEKQDCEWSLATAVVEATKEQLKNDNQTN